ncbi:MAG: gliding motility-associated C-terminal domain-containing protein [Saprospiraceae bacterium]
MIGECNNNGTPADSTDDTFEVTFNISALNQGSGNMFHISDGDENLGSFEYEKDNKITLSADGLEHVLTFSDDEKSNCIVLSIVTQASCSEEVGVADENIEIPNIFSPDGDSYNDQWYIKTTNPDLKILSCRIFDRWGELVYHSENDNNFRWDGNFRDSKATVGVYVYLIEYQTGSGEKVMIAGDVTLVR